MRKLVWGSALVGVILVVSWVVWVVWERLERKAQVERASQNNQIVVDQYAFSPGKCRFILPLDRHASTQSIISACEKFFMNQYVPEETYGQTWTFEHSSTRKLIPLNNESLEAAGVEPGTVLRILRLESGKRN
jgi:hypothetical protein